MNGVNMVHIHNGYLSSHKEQKSYHLQKNGWELEIIMVSEITQK